MPTMMGWYNFKDFISKQAFLGVFFSSKMTTILAMICFKKLSSKYNFLKKSLKPQSFPKEQILCIVSQNSYPACLIFQSL